MKRIFLSAIVSVMALFAAVVPASALDLYASGSLGTAFVPNRDNSGLIGAAFGVGLNKYVRSELAFDSFISGGNSGGNLGPVQVFVLTSKTYLQYPVTSLAIKFTPYVDGGFGLANIGGNGAINQSNFVYTFGGGVMFPITPKFELGAGYEYWSSTINTVTAPSTSSLWTSNVVKLTGRYRF